METLYKDLAIIGAGPGGYELAIKASEAGLDTCLFEYNKLGGTCLNRGCIPTKIYYQYAKIKKEANNLYNQELSVNFKEMKTRKDEVVSTLIKGIEASLKNVTIINERALLTKENDNIIDIIIIKSDNFEVRAKNIVIATGSKEKLLPIKGIEYAHTSNDILDLEELPKRMAIIGGGVIGMEIASIFNAFGVEISVFEYFPQILPRIDKEVSRRLQNLLKLQGIKINTNANVTSINKMSDKYTLNASINDKDLSFEFDYILFSTGRMPNINDIGLDNIGIEYTKNGIIVDKYNQTNIKNVYAIGDALGGIMLAHKATSDGIIVLNHILGKEEKINLDLIPACSFTFPEIATIGLSEDDCKEKQIEYKILKELYRSNGKAHAIKETDGFVKIIVNNKDDIIGASIIGSEANLLIHEISTLMNAKIKVSDAKYYIHAHPTLSEIILSCLNKDNQR